MGDINVSLERKKSLRKMLIQVEKDLLNSHKISQSKREKKAVDSIKKNKKCFFSYVNQFSNTSSKIGPLITNNDVFITDPQQMAELLSD